MDSYLDIDLKRQQLTLFRDREEPLSFSVSTSRLGAGEQTGSGCTPRGRHRIRLKIGAGCAPNTVFIGRRPTGEFYTSQLGAAYPKRDWILTRILWLTGAESGVNRGGACDTLRRFIYIHGTPDEVTMGKPDSHGCIRMRNDDLIELFDAVEVGSEVLIHE